MRLRQRHAVVVSHHDLAFEALARWTHPELGEVPPDRFLPVAEHCGLAGDLTRQLLRQACQDALAWPPHVRLSFNISPRQLKDRTLGAQILAILAEQRKSARDPEAFFVLDEAFHRGLANAAECAYAWKVIEEAKAQMDRVRFLSIPDATPVDRLIVQHQAILDAIAAGRGAAAEQAMRDHLREILKSLPRLSRAFPEMFEEEDIPAVSAKAKRRAAR